MVATRKRMGSGMRLHERQAAAARQAQVTDEIRERERELAAARQRESNRQAGDGLASAVELATGKRPHVEAGLDELKLHCEWKDMPKLIELLTRGVTGS